MWRPDPPSSGVRRASTSPTRKRWVPWLAAVALAALVAFVLFAIRVDALRAGRASGPNWTFPACVYSDDVPLVPGRPLPAEYLTAQLEARGYRAVAETTPAAGTFARRGEVFGIALRGFGEAHDPLGASGPERVRVRIRDGWLTAVERLGAARDASAPRASAIGRRADPRAAPPASIPRLEPMLVALLYDQTRTWRIW